MKKFIQDAKNKRKLEKSEQKSNFESGLKEKNSDNWRNTLFENPHEFINQLESINNQLKLDQKVIIDTFNNSIFTNYAIAITQSIKDKNEENSKFLLENYTKVLQTLEEHVIFHFNFNLDQLC